MNLPPVSHRYILDLCGGTGAWSKPYRDAGYPVRVVTWPDDDVRLYVPPKHVWGVLAAPPCTEFSAARNGRPDIPKDYVRGMELVAACMRIILQCRPQWWVLENPKFGELGKFLGRAHFSFDPWEFGDPWAKPTALWGEFSKALVKTPVKPQGPLHMAQRRSFVRATTPPGFAKAFAKANP